MKSVRLDLFNTTAFRLSVGYTLLVTLAVGVTLGSAYLLTESLITDEIDLIIATELKTLEDQYARAGVPGVTDEINLKIDSWGRIGAVYMLADGNFERIAGNVTHWPFDGMPTERWPEFEIATIEPGRRAVHPVRAAVRTLPGGDLLLVGTDISQGRRFADKFRFATLWGIGLSTLAAALAGLWFSYKLARRVGEVTRTCQRILAGETGRRLPVAGVNDEFDTLAILVNRVLDRLEEQAGTLRATFDSAAHDLRAPLHRLRTRMDALLLRSPPLEPAVHESIESALREVDHLQRTLATLLQIALAESGAPLASAASVDVGELAAELVELFEPVAGDKGLALDCRHDAPAVVQGNRQLLAQLLTNLIENGLKYVPAGGRIEVAVRRLSHSVRLTVSDNGPGIATEDRLRAAQPFVRFGTSPRGEGSGLGLSLVAAIARLHRGRLELESNDPGLKVVIELPA
ncbi:MAG: HAMP domain-containing histidine kinase [Gammaproteobacteria bacterium]|nr:MAG: HAMP domain-containing histidine kinase [Gammaproteobacteria bacterium]TLZ04475.1 MAG: HAMP domain-containing histidine kinase [Gammaproteobacteria bacterium]TLZ29115.1 MAG: HAMP domain-containing histidine kinase [Gammaproteobacteria bacterium]